MKEDVKIAYFEGLIADPEKMNKCIFNVIESADFNNDDQISRTEFKVDTYLRFRNKNPAILKTDNEKLSQYLISGIKFPTLKINYDESGTPS